MARREVITVWDGDETSWDDGDTQWTDILRAVIEILTRLRLPIVPSAPDEVARLEDVSFGRLGVFWFEQEDGNLYLVSDTEPPPAFELEDGNLYYIVQEA